MIEVQAINAVGTSAKSLSLAVRTPPNSRPEAPAAPVVAMSGDDLQVKWEAPWNGNSRITKYAVEFQSKTGSWTSYSGCPNGVKTMCTFAFESFKNRFDIAGGDSIVAKVTATNALGSSESDQSKALELPKSEDIAPAITFEDVTGDSMSIAFEGNEGIDEYTINVYKRDPVTGDIVLDQVITKKRDEEARRRLSGRQLATSFACPTSSAPNVVSTAIPALEPNTEYFFEVVVAGVKSDRVSQRTQAPATPGAPTVTSVNAREDEFTVFWDRPLGTTLSTQYVYVDQVGLDGEAQSISGSPFVISSDQSTQKTIRDLKSGTQYRVRV
jgi:hypothetical protein